MPHYIARTDYRVVLYITEEKGVDAVSETAARQMIQETLTTETATIRQELKEFAERHAMTILTDVSLPRITAIDEGMPTVHPGGPPPVVTDPRIITEPGDVLVSLPPKRKSTRKPKPEPASAE